MKCPHIRQGKEEKPIRNNQTNIKNALNSQKIKHKNKIEAYIMRIILSSRKKLKKALLLSAFASKKVRIRGSLTLEAAVAVPLFILAISQMIFWIKFCDTQTSLSALAAAEARKVAANTFFTEEEPDDTLVFSTKGEKLNGIYFSRTAVARTFTGRYYDENTGENKGNILVFVTENGKVYHNDKACSHIKLSIKAVQYSEVKNLRNADGGKYYRCERCIKGEPHGQVFITKEGRRIHSHKRCSGIKRTVRGMPLKEAKALGYRPCERCRFK